MKKIGATGWVAIAAALLVGLALNPVLNPANAHVGGNVNHLWEHIKNKLSTLGRCEQSVTFVAGFASEGQPYCNGVEGFAGFRDSATINSTMQPVAVLDELPDGHFVIFAKVNAQAPVSGEKTATTTCQLTAGSDTDEASETTTPEIANGTMALNVVHQFTGFEGNRPGAVLSCQTSNPSGSVSQIKMTGIRLTEVRNYSLRSP